MAEPRDDMISKIIASEIDGRQPSFEELMSIGFLMFLAGLDTVTNAMSFGMRHLAHDDGLRQRAIDDPAVIPSMVEELLRRYAFVATPRYIVEDTELEGRSEEHTSELQSLMRNSYAVFRLQKKN